MELRIFDVEHGACAVLACDDGSYLMIDAGHNVTTGWRPGDYLAGRGVQNLAMLVISNCDEDHVSGLPNLFSRVGVAWLLSNPTISSEAIKVLKSEAGIGVGVEL